MASVHLARMTADAGFSRTVAVKRLRSELAGDPEFTVMFLDEARLAARVRHPNVVPIIDVVSLEGELFLVMEYVHGEPLSNLLRKSRAPVPPPSPRVVAAVMCNVLEGLHAVHEARGEDGALLGLVHRDVSPQNVLVGSDGVARVIDLGIAKGASRAQPTTRSGQLKGKLAYMAPEQIRGTVSRATDVYAAGLVLWESLTARRAFIADNEGALLDRVMTATLDPPSRWAADLPPGLDAVVAKALARSPGARFATARAMARALEEAVPPAGPAEVGRWVEELAHERLVTLTESIGAIELGATPPAPAPSRGAEAGASPARSETELTKGLGPTPVTRFRPGRLVPVALGVVAAASLVAVALGRSSSTATTSPAASTSATSATTSPPPGTPPPSGDTLAPAPPTDTASASASAPDSSAPEPSASAFATARPKQAGSGPVKAPRRDCDPPFTMDRDGIRHYKRECGG
jgi:serine/threonine-protein kinase